MMTEYIRREDAICALREAVRKYPNSFFSGIDLANKIISNLPKADVETILTGEWKTTTCFPHHVYCSICNKTYVPNDRWQIWVDNPEDGGLPRDFCPNCGAFMKPNIK